MLPQPSPLPATHPTVAAAVSLSPIGLLDADGPEAEKLNCSNVFSHHQGLAAVSGVMRKRNKDGIRPAAIYEAVAILALTPNHLPKGAGLKEPHFPFPQARQVSREPTQLILNWCLMGGQKADPTEMGSYICYVSPQPENQI